MGIVQGEKPPHKRPIKNTGTEAAASVIAVNTADYNVIHNTFIIFTVLSEVSFCKLRT